MRGKALFLLCFLLIATACASAQVNATFEQQTTTWTLSNDQFESQFQLREGLFRIVRLQGGGRLWINNAEPAVSPIRLSIDSMQIGDDTRWALLDTKIDASQNGAKAHIVSLYSDSLKVLLTLRLEAYPDQPFLRTSYNYRNLDSGTRYVTSGGFLRVALNTGGRTMSSLRVNQFVQGTPIAFGTFRDELASLPDRTATVFSGANAPDCTFLSLRDSSDAGVVFGWEFDGQAHFYAQLDPTGNRVDVWGSPDSLHLPVLAGAGADLPPSFVGFFAGDWDEGGYRIQRFADQVLAGPMPDNSFPWLAFDSWFYGQNIDEVTMRKAADNAAAVGVELFIVDLGWATQMGEWTGDPKKFPSGMRSFSDYVHSLGMKIGLHFTPAQAMAQSPVLVANPDWPSSVPSDYYGGTALCLGNAPAQQWTRDQVRRLVNEYNIDWVTQDDDDLYKICTKETHTHDPKNSNWSSSEDGISSLVKAMRQEFPLVFWENNSCGGDMSTFNAVKHYATMGSCDGCAMLERRQVVYGMSYVFPPRFIDRYQPESLDIYSSRSSMFGGPWILMQRISDWTAEEIEFARKEAEIYKSLRGLIRDGKVFHLRYPDGSRIDAIESFNYAQNRGVIFVFRPDSEEDSIELKPRGLNPDSVYTVRFQESTDGFTALGSALMTDGIHVDMPWKNYAEIVYITPAPAAPAEPPSTEPDSN